MNNVSNTAASANKMLAAVYCRITLLEVWLSV